MNPALHLRTRIWSLLDQICFSAANFILVICFARYYSDVQVAGYGIGLSLALILQSALRNSYVVQNAVLAPGIFRRRARAVLGQHAVMWGGILLCEALLAIMLWLVFPGDYAHAIILATLVCSLIYAQLDFDRIALTKHNRMPDALYASIIFLILAAGLFILIPAMQVPFAVSMGLVGLYATLKILRLVMIIGAPDMGIGRRLASRAVRKYLANALLGVAGYAGHTHGPLFILGLVASAGPLAAFVAMRGLMQPLMVIIRSLDVIDKSLVQSESGRSHSALRRILFRQLLCYAVLCMAAIAAVMLLGPFIVSLVYAGRYDAFVHLLTGWAAIFSLLALTFPVETVIVKLERLKRFNVLRLWAGAVGLLLALWLCPQLGAMGAIWACIAGGGVSLLCALWLIRDVIRDK